MDRNVLSQAMEDYLKAIYKLLEMGQQVSTSALAEYMGVAPASATNMCKKMADLHLLEYAPYQGVDLTPAGRKLALEIIRHHRLLELYLAEALGVPWDQVHEEAEKLEHVLSEELEERMAEVLGDPRFDPHGAPIPTRTGDIHPHDSGRLVDMKAGDRLQVVEVDDEDSEILRYLGKLGIYPGTRMTLLETAPFQGPLTVLVGDNRYNLGYQVASSILVTAEESNSPWGDDTEG